MSITWSIKTFDALSNKELYQILKLRNEVFIVEQKCAYDDIDGKDLLPSHHLFCMAQDVVIAYARIFGPGIIYAEACLGRICSSSAHRKQGLGKALMQHALAHTEQLYPAQSIRKARNATCGNFMKTLASG
ncbi:MAG TPA: GNAT family N-acetyltransferase [Cyclobacteriaceae bacterium]|nr:GNAT family N-acetyltransferase [Cyclobacteriaceae bacterium]